MVALSALVAGVVWYAANAGDGESVAQGSTSEEVESTPSTVATLPNLDPENAQLTGAEVAHACLEPGQRQTIEVNGSPGTLLLYQAIYADGASGIESFYYGGNDRGTIAEDGAFSADWTIGVDAPVGGVEVHVYDVLNTAHIGGPAATTSFELVPDGSQCVEEEM